MNQPHRCVDTDSLVAYLYEECDIVERRRVEDHVATCLACAQELEGLRAVRHDLTAWMPPDRELGFAVVQTAGARPAAPQGWSAPRWLAAAAAVLLLAGAAAIANFEVRYDADGFAVRTGWQPAAPPAASASPDATGPKSGAAAAPWTMELTALERQLRREFSLTRSPATVSAAAAPEGRKAIADADLLRRMRALIDESERRQQRELALRLSQVVREIETQRRADLIRIEQGFGQIEGRTGAEAAQQRQVLNYLVRVSQRR